TPSHDGALTCRSASIRAGNRSALFDAHSPAHARQGPFDTSHLAGFATALALVGAIVLEAWLVREKPERAWYDGRVLAEATKTLAWRFAMGAHTRFREP
ncbi:hypothetical protein DMA12_26510, partial [Amycolatopsis balhimycina DSM 5908]